MSDLNAASAAIFEHAPIGIVITDQDARFLDFNAQFQSLLGYSKEELRRMTGWDVTHEADAARNSVLRAELLSGQRTKFVHEKRYRRKDGAILWVQNTVAFIRGADGLPYTIALVEDITQRRLAERRLVELQEAQRRELARELHDQVGQTLTALRINLDLIGKRQAARNDEVIRDRCDDSLELVKAAFKSVENVMYELRPPLLDEYGLIAPLQWYARNFAKRTGIGVEVRGDEDARRRPEIELALFRIAQEALTNVARHAGASRVEIEVTQAAEEVVLTIADNGTGNAPRESADKPGYGLISMRERAQAVDGSFEVAFEGGAGTRVTVRVPTS